MNCGLGHFGNDMMQLSYRHVSICTNLRDIADILTSLIEQTDKMGLELNEKDKICDIIAKAF
jgi:hypothetical protein